jgi:hypothetical protein
MERAAAKDLRDAVTLRAALLVLGVLGLQIAFVVSYIGALHHPRPHHIDLVVAAPAPAGPALVKQLNAIADEPLKARSVAGAATARRQVLRRDADAALVVTGPGRAQLLVATAAGPALAEATEEIMTAVAQRSGLRLSVTDLRAPAAGDRNALSSFYLVIGWSVGGYLVASILGVSAGARPSNLRRAAIRLAAMAAYAVVSGLAGAIVVGPVLHALPTGLAHLWWLGALLVFATAALTMAFQVVLGVVGIGLAIVLFVVLGNPSSGGVFPGPLLPPFWRAIGPWLSTGAATTAVRDVTYFDAVHLWPNVLVVAAYGVVGVVVSLLVPALRKPGTGTDRASS